MHLYYKGIFLYSNKNVTFVIKCKKLIRVLQKDGWYQVRSKGSHLRFKHPQKEGHVTVPFHGSSELSTGTFYSIIKQAQIEWKK